MPTNSLLDTSLERDQPLHGPSSRSIRPSPDAQAPVASEGHSSRSRWHSGSKVCRCVEQDDERRKTEEQQAPHGGWVWNGRGRSRVEWGRGEMGCAGMMRARRSSPSNQIKPYSHSLYQQSIDRSGRGGDRPAIIASRQDDEQQQPSRQRPRQKRKVGWVRRIGPEENRSSGRFSSDPEDSAEVIRRRMPNSRQSIVMSAAVAAAASAAASSSSHVDQLDMLEGSVWSTIAGHGTSTGRSIGGWTESNGWWLDRSVLGSIMCGRIDQIIIRSIPFIWVGPSIST